MKHFTKSLNIVFFFCSLVLCSCWSTDVRLTDLRQYDKNESGHKTNSIVTFQQDTTVHHLNNSISVIRLKKDSIKIKIQVPLISTNHINTSFVKLAAFKDKRQLAQLRYDTQLTPSMLFCDGSCLAGHPNKPYSSLFISEHGTHCINWDENGQKRAKLISHNQESAIIEVQFGTYFVDKKEAPLQAFDESSIYLVIFIDKNSNNEINNGEYHIITINFEHTT